MVGLTEATKLTQLSYMLGENMVRNIYMYESVHKHCV